MDRGTKVLQQQVARGVILKSLEVCFPSAQGAVWLEATLATEGIQLGDEFQDVLHYLASKGLVVPERDGDTIKRARLHQRGLDVVHGLVDVAGIHISGGIHPDVPSRRGRLLQSLEVTYPQASSLAVLRLQLQRFGFLELTDTGVLRELVYLQDLGLVECVETRVFDQTVRLWRLTADGIDVVESGHAMTGIDVSRRG
jgi:hypothetical protein